MWPSLTETPKIIQAIYGEIAPSLRSINITELNIVNGIDIQCFLKFNIKELPKEMPLKWLDRNVNTVQIDILFICSRIIFFEILNGPLTGDLEVELIDDYKRVSLNKEGNTVFIIESKWLNIRSVTGYAEEL